jgi:hypothetical protein
MGSTAARVLKAEASAVFFSVKLKPRSCSAGCLRMMDRLLGILSLGGLALIVAAPLWQ